MSAPERIELGGGAWLLRVEAWVPEPARDLERLRAEVSWGQRAIRMFGREVAQPRLTAWLGDPGAVYTYSGLRHEPASWHPIVEGYRRRLRDELGLDFDGALLNLYRDGADSMGWHADDEPELGPEPVLASVSLGAPRRFLLKRRRGPTSAPLRMMLGEGALLVMGGRTQRDFVHALPKCAEAGPRLNLTYRRLLDRRDEA